MIFAKKRPTLANEDRDTLLRIKARGAATFFFVLFAVKADESATVVNHHQHRSWPCSNAGRVPAGESSRSSYIAWCIYLPETRALERVE